MWNEIGFLIVVLIIGGLSGAVIVMYNSLIKLRNGADNAWSQINVQLERRADLVSNLVETVKGYAKHEKTTLKGVTEARAGLSNAETVKENEKANTHLTKTLRSLFAVAEAYPDLKADESFEDLMKQLSETENQIAYYRQLYNDVVWQYNNKCQMFPSNIVANFFGFEEERYFEINEAEKTVPHVDFTSDDTLEAENI
ncbi:MULTISPECIES: LemA family protein [Methanobacterium]|jgi:LemA protein|uniref:LemA family protein n=1 Tax=Methanobacterium veterum TaxID=408577 RepID=A0A9E5A0B8_9EURY|nr:MULTISPECIES: LemA family protein [Methanobacterium]MCZ3364509.1 LemA family protein [Methanobacterium veterum]MCZ3372262.1 LemA family protein [Methanobacterium veterum]